MFSCNSVRDSSSIKHENYVVKKPTKRRKLSLKKNFFTTTQQEIAISAAKQFLGTASPSIGRHDIIGIELKTLTVMKRYADTKDAVDDFGGTVTDMEVIDIINEYKIKDGMLFVFSSNETALLTHMRNSVL